MKQDVEKGWHNLCHAWDHHAPLSKINIFNNLLRLLLPSMEYQEDDTSALSSLNASNVNKSTSSCQSMIPSWKQIEDLEL